jgi:hypothetical protein
MIREMRVEKMFLVAETDVVSYFQIDQSIDRLSTTRFRNRRRVKPIMTEIGTIRDLSSCDSVGRLRGGNLRMAKLMTDWPPHKILIKT